MSNHEMNFKFYAILFALMGFITLSLGVYSHGQSTQLNPDIDYVSIAD